MIYEDDYDGYPTDLVDEYDDRKYEEMKDDALLCSSKEEYKALKRMYGNAINRWVSDCYKE